MLIYEVNLRVDAGIADDYAGWLRAHIPEMLQIEGFERAVWLRQDPDPAGRRQWTIQYHVAGREHLQNYLDRHAGQMRGEGAERFEGQFEAARRVLEERETFRP